MTYMWTDPSVVRAVVDNKRPVLRLRRMAKASRRVSDPVPMAQLPRLVTARPTEASGA